MKLPQINRSCKKILTYFPCRITLQCIKIIIKWQELYFINTEPWALYIARNARLKSWSIVRKSKLRWVSIKESIEHFDLSMREHKIFFFKKRKQYYIYFNSLLMVMAIFLNPNENRVIACLIKIKEYFFILVCFKLF